MRIYDIIEKKRFGKKLSEEEIRWFIRHYTEGSIPDYQAAALLMAICINGMDAKETLQLTLAMAESGARMDLSAIRGIKADKHSTGGVGDKVSLILAPLVAACGVPVVKMSGRGLGHTGGTIDKLESIPGFSAVLTEEQFIRQGNEIGLAMTGQSADLTPADQKLYALRDVTATVESIPLIASSIMSKKLAAGADAIVLDVKWGDGAFMKTREAAQELADLMTEIGTQAGRKMSAVISDMNQPLGMAVGNALEVKEAIAALQGNGPADLMEDCYALGEQMLCLGGAADSPETARVLLGQAIRTGAAYEKMLVWVSAQGGDTGAIQDTDRLPTARYRIPVPADETGTVVRIACRQIGTICGMLGGGRMEKDDRIDPAVGIVLEKKCGMRTEKGEPLAVIHANDKKRGEEAAEMCMQAYQIEK